jgi:DNA-binding LytR/AlgR family response regulator
MNCLAIDDEPLALNVLKEFCQKVDYLNLVAVCTNPFEALQWINRQQIDLIFLDIQMPNITGIEFVRTLKNPPLIVFTTAYSNYALEGFELNAIDYLVKPISFERFLKAINKAYEIITLRKNKLNPFTFKHEEKVEYLSLPYLIVKAEYKSIKIDIDQILFIEGLKDYIKIYAGTKPVLTKSTMKNIEEKLPANVFVRVHKSFIVSLPKINAIENNRIIIGEKRIPIGHQFKAHFYELIDKMKI